MSLQLILGNSGSGKSHFLYETVIRESMERPKESFLVIVPEQFTMETQKKLVQLHPRKGILNIDVLSFQRLALRVLEDTGADRRRILEETGKSLVIRRCAMENEKDLTLLGESIRKPGYIRQVKSMISELSQYNLEPADLGELLPELEGNPRLYYKCKDLEILYRSFREHMEKEYVTAEEVLEVLTEHAGESALLQGCTIALDGFTGFTPIQQKLLEKLFTLAKKIMVTVTVDIREDWGSPKGMHELFYLSKKTIHSLTVLCRNTGTEIVEPVLLGKGASPRFRDQPALAYLERNLFRGGRTYHREKPYEKDQQEISIHLAANPREEVRFAAEKILELVRGKHCTYGEIGLISGDMETYAREVRRLFPQYGIPFFVDETRRVLLNPFLEYIKAALEMVARDYSYESVFRFLRTGLVDVSSKDVDMVENYVLAAGICGYSRWKKPWEQCTRTFSREKLDLLNCFREQFLSKTGDFTDSMKGRGITVRQRCEALYHFIVKEHIQEKLYRMEQNFEALGQVETAKEYHQIYGVVMALLDKMVEFLGDEVMSLLDFKELLEAGFEDSKVGIIPPSPDQVLVGDMERTRLKDIKVLFFWGLNEGIVPSGKNTAGLLSEQERSFLGDKGVSLAPGARENSFVERFYLYLHLTKPSKRLFLTLVKSDMDGKVMRPSYVLSRIRKMFPALKIQDEDEDPSLAKRVWTPANGMEYVPGVIKAFREGEASGEMLELFQWYRSRPQYEEKLEWLVKGAFSQGKSTGIGKAAARALYGTVLNNSVSRLESFAACAYAHFLQYGLGLSEREKLEFAPVDMGNLFHRALELFARKLEQSTYTWFDVPEEKAKEFTEQAIEEAVSQYQAPGLFKDKRSAYGLKRIRRIMERTIWALLIQIRRGSFVPGSFEVTFSAVEDLEAVNISLSGEENMRLKGRIDRIDYCETENQVYVKVVDYKSGNTKFDLAALYYGLKLQLVVYMNAALELEKRVFPEKEVIPAGIFYYHVEDPLLELSGEISEEKIREQLLKELKVNGIVNSKEEIIRAMDRNLSGTSDVIPVSVNKDGSLGKASKTLDTDEFRLMSSYVNQKLKGLGKEIMEGKTAVNPYRRKNQTACDYCAFREVCGFDPKMEDMDYRRLSELTEEEIFRRMKETEA